MKINHLYTAAVIALAAFTQSTRAAERPPLPGFMTHDQLAKWNSDQERAKATKQAANLRHLPVVSPPFYTGRPYDVDSENYLFKFRTYNPSQVRWTTTDPSGFPDGSNIYRYLADPTSSLDYSGLFSLSTTAASPSTAYKPMSTTFYAEAYDLSHVDTGSGAHSTLASRLATEYPSFNVTMATSNYAGTVTVQTYKALNYDKNLASKGALDLQVILSGVPTEFTWLQIARAKINFEEQWGEWYIDTIQFGAPSYDSSNDPSLHDHATLGGWMHNGIASGASKEFYTFAAVKDGTNITVYDAFSWGGIVRE